jgi:hypothetical protein
VQGPIYIPGTGGGGPSTGPDVPVINYDWTTAAGVTASGVVTTRTGATLYLQRGAGVAVAVGNNTPLFEDFGADDIDPASGGGIWAGLDSYSNSFALPFDFATGWTVDAGVVYTANAGNGPDGTATADKVHDASAIARQAIYRASATVGYMTIWYMDAPADVPTAPGCLAADNTPTILTALVSTASWKRARLEAATTSNFTIIPAGGAALGDTGGILVWGAQVTTGNNAARFPLPLAGDNSATGFCSTQLKAGDLTGLVVNGALNVAIRARPCAEALNYFATSATPYCYASATIVPASGGAGLEYSLWWGRNAAAVDRTWFVRVNGIEVATASSSMTAQEYPAIAAWMAGDELTMHWYVDGATVRMRLEVNACMCAEKTTSYSGVPLGTCTAFYFGSNGTTANTSAKMRYTAFKSYNTSRDWNSAPKADLVFLGDSTMGHTNDFAPIATQICTVTEARAGFRIASIAKSGETMALQLAKLLACPYMGDSRVRGFVNCWTVNDINAGTTAATITASGQSMQTAQAASNPTAKTFFLAPEPVDAWAGMVAGDQTIWITCYKNVRGDGPNPITGATVVNTAISDSENTGGALGTEGNNTLIAANNRTATYGGSAAGSGDSVHEYNVARRAKAAAIRALINAQGIGPP